MYNFQKKGLRGFISGMVIGLLAGAIAHTHLHAHAQEGAPESHEDLISLRVRDAEAKLLERGYEYRWAEEHDEGHYTYWTHYNTRECLMVRTVEGRYDAIVSSAADDCDRGDPGHVDLGPGAVPPALADLMGLRTTLADDALRQRGYTYRRHEALTDSVASYWVEGSTGQCVEVIASNNEYEAIAYVQWYHCSALRLTQPI